jgi:CheY-like chemotaxis protein
VLLVHPSRSIRALIKKYIFAELSDIEITEARDGRQALNLFSDKGFDVIVSTDRLKDMGVTELKSNLESTGHNGPLPLIVIAESESKHDRNKLLQQGFDRVVQIRVRPADLIKKINAVCNPRDWRRDARYHIPKAMATIATQKGEHEASLINISMGGVFVELMTEDPCELMKGELSIALQVPFTSDTASIEGLTAKLLRLEAVTWNTDRIPKTMRATFIFDNLKPGPKGKLAELIQMAKEDKRAATEVKD